MTEIHSLKQKILDLVEHSESKLTRVAIVKMVSAESNIRRKDIRKAVTALISDRELQYTNVFGNSYVEKSYNRPVRISSSVIVKPYNMTYQPKDDEIVINMVPGVSFGYGDHPTTRLSVQGIEFISRHQHPLKNAEQSSVLDIGTGSGILAIAALKFGIETGIGIDTDPCAVSEAKKNVQINDLESRLRICPPFQPMSDTFSLITANLRFPDIMTLFPIISNHSRLGAYLVLSGIRPAEVDAVTKQYAENGFHCIRTTEEKNWSCLVWVKT